MELPEGCHWSWAELTDEDLKVLRRCLVGIVAIPPGSGPIERDLGTGFIVAMGDGQALCITAAHVIEGARSSLDLRLRSAPSTPLEFLPRVDNSLVGAAARGEIRAHVIYEGEPDLATIDAGEGFREFDVMLLSLKSKLFSGTRLPWGLALNSDIQPEGTHVLAVGLPGVRTTAAPWTDDQLLTIVERLEVRAGTIRKIHTRGHRHLATPTYELSMPLPAGMSGGPILRIPAAPGGSLQVIGIASYDLQAQGGGPDDDPTWPGESLAVPINVALLTALPAGPGQEKTLLDFVRSGQVLDMGTFSHHLEVVRDEDGIPRFRLEPDVPAWY
jgi:Trypsin-like peptidase domain